MKGVSVPRPDQPGRGGAEERLGGGRPERVCLPPSQPSPCSGIALGQPCQWPCDMASPRLQLRPWGHLPPQPAAIWCPMVPPSPAPNLTLSPHPQCRNQDLSCLLQQARCTGWGFTAWPGVQLGLPHGAPHSMTRRTTPPLLHKLLVRLL